MYSIWRQHVLLILCFATWAFFATSGSVSAQDEANGFSQQLEALALKCDELGLKHQAEITRQWIVPARPDQQIYYPFQNVDHFRPAATATQLEKFWYERFIEIRNAEAERLYQQALQLEDTSQAYRLLHHVLHENHRHRQARKLLGYSDSTVLQLRPNAVRGKKIAPLTGWQAGEYYTVKSAHFEITTNATAAEGVALARELETMYTVWQQAFVEFWCNKAAWKKKLSGENALLYNKRVHRIVLFAEQDEYIQFFRQRSFQNLNSSGFYSSSSKTAFLHLGKTIANPWLHEVAHQLFFELGPALQNIAEEQNVWAIEGVATYMESLQDFGRFVTLGGFESKRLQYARFHTLVNQSYEPLEQLTTLGNRQLTVHPRIVTLYSQCSGLAHFLLDGKNGLYRQAFLDLLRKIYTRTDTGGSLAQLARISYQQLDEEYHQFLVIDDEDLSRLRPNTELAAFCAAHSHVTDTGLAKLKGQQNLTWLDLTGCSVSDNSIPLFQSLPGLREVMLDGTNVSDDSVKVLANLQNLELLDLANTKVTDKAPQMLAGKPTLTVLYLTGTQVTDRAAPNLETIVNLEILELSGTKMSVEVRDKLKSNLLKLQP